MIGIESTSDVNKIAQLCLKLKNINSIVLSGENNIPYVVLDGETSVAEAWKDKIFAYTLTPDLLDLKTTDMNNLKCSDVQESAKLLLDVFDDCKKNEIYDLLTINSALALYISKKAPSLFEAFELSKKIINERKVFEKILQLRKIFPLN